MCKNRNNIIITTLKVEDDIYKDVGDLDVEDRLKKLVKELVKRIKQKLNGFNDIFFKYAYENADVLHEIVQFHSVNEGGSHRNGIIYIGEMGFMSSEMGSDDDIMATIFHEFMHYIAFKLDIYPKRYENRERGEIWSILIEAEASLETEEEFYDNAYNSFLMAGYNGSDSEKYLNYPDLYQKLSKEQRSEVDQYIIERGLKPEICARNFQYYGSNHAKDEINAHKKTIDGHQLDIFIMSSTKLNFYDNEIKRYTEKYNNCLEIERKYGYTPEGYKQ